MQRTLLLCVAVLLALLPAPPAQDGKPQEPAKTPKKASGPASDAQKLREDLLGAWELVGAEVSGERFSGGACRGVMLVMDGYMSITVQLDSDTIVVRGTFGELFSAGAYRWNYDGDRLLLVTSTLLAIDNFDPNDRVGYEAQGARREFRVDLAGDALTLSREGGGRLSFVRLQPPQRKEPPAKK